MNQSLRGGCLCGSVRFTANPADRDVAACHCSMCRKWTAGPFLVVDCADTLKIEDDANLGVYQSSDWAERAFCKRCGTSLFYRLIDRNLHFVSAEAFDQHEGYALKAQIFIEEKPSYYDFANETHNMTGPEVLASFGPPDHEKPAG